MTTTRSQSISVKILRQNPLANEEPHYVVYAVPLRPDRKTSVMNVLEYIAENLDPSLAFYVSCHVGLCGGCAMRINGKTRLACQEEVTGDLVLEPTPGRAVVRDLIVIPQHRSSPFSSKQEASQTTPHTQQEDSHEPGA